MFEPTKKHRVSDAVAQTFPKEVTDQIFQVVNLMVKANQIVVAPVAIIFSDDFTDDELYAMMIQATRHRRRSSPSPTKVTSHSWATPTSLS